MDLITDEQWQIIEPLLPPHIKTSNVIDDRLVCSAIAQSLLGHVSWDAAATNCGVGVSTLRLRWLEWSATNVWPRLWSIACKGTDDSHKWAKNFAFAALERMIRNANRRRATDPAAVIDNPLRRPSPADYRNAWRAQCDHDGTL